MYFSMLAQLLLFGGLFNSLAISTEVGVHPYKTNGTVEERCRTNLKRMEVLPGRGWDSLRNKDMGQVLDISYNTCQTSEDGHYLIPDDIYITAIKQTNLQLSSELFQHWSESSSLTAKSFEVNAGYNHFGLFGVQSSFGTEYQQTKESQVKENSVTTRVQLRTIMYKIQASPSAAIDPKLKELLNDAITALQENNERKAEVLLEFVLRDYGTHYITQAEAGAALVQENFINSKYVTSGQSQINKIKFAASVNFLERFSFGTSASSSKENHDANGYEENKTSGKANALGGAIFQPNMTVQEWAAQIPNNLVTTDRAGNPLSYLITPQQFRGVSMAVVGKLRDKLNDVIKTYYNYNTHVGCTDPKSVENFDYSANADDGSCNNTCKIFNFGGLYVTCSNENTENGDLCTKLSQPNPLTRGFNCSIGFTPMFLTNGTVKATGNRQYCKTDCRKLDNGKRMCSEICEYHSSPSQASYKAHWCMPITNNAQSQLLFGGLYTSWVNNPVTKTQACPLAYVAINVGTNLKVCVSNKIQLGSQYAVQFGGFFTCNQGNPLAEGSEWPEFATAIFAQGCPSGYGQHMAIVDDNDCEILYCVKANSYKNNGQIEIILPPFRDPSTLFDDPIPSELQKSKPDTKDGRDLPASSITWIVVGCILIVAVISCVTLVTVKKYKRNVKRYREESNQDPLPPAGLYGAILEEG